ncbi:MAG: hypothetical protein DYG91_02455 [Chloroflexi bacterium CFX7]|nr:MAG: hypothetical protein EDM76_00740 [bacterium]MCE7927350.1 hypothetical protein [Chloroflexi bacterium CFX7]
MSRISGAPNVNATVASRAASSERSLCIGASISPVAFRAKARRATCKVDPSGTSASAESTIFRSLPATKLARVTKTRRNRSPFAESSSTRISKCEVSGVSLFASLTGRSNSSSMVVVSFATPSSTSRSAETLAIRGTTAGPPPPHPATASRPASIATISSAFTSHLRY